MRGDFEPTFSDRAIRASAAPFLFDRMAATQDRESATDDAPLWEPQPSASRVWIIQCIVAALLFLGFDFALAPIIGPFGKGVVGACLACFGTGMLTGQIFALTTWLALARQPLLRRVLVYWLLVSLVCGSWLAGMSIFAPMSKEAGLNGLTWRLLRFAIVSLPFSSLVVQLPLWLLRVIWKWRLVVADQPTDCRPNRISIADLLAATTYAALLLASAKAVGFLGPGLWSIVAAAMAVVFAVSLITLPALTWAMLRTTSLGRGPATAFGVIFGLSLLLAALGGFYVVLIVLAVVAVGYLTSVGICGALAFNAGLRLKVGHECELERDADDKLGPASAE